MSDTWPLSVKEGHGIRMLRKLSKGHLIAGRRLRRARYAACMGNITYASQVSDKDGS
jgi:hypothetical protein